MLRSATLLDFDSLVKSGAVRKRKKQQRKRKERRDRREKGWRRRCRPGKLKAQYSRNRLSPGKGSAMLVNRATRRWDSCQQETDA